MIIKKYIFLLMFLLLQHPIYPFFATENLYRHIPSQNTVTMASAIIIGVVVVAKITKETIVSEISRRLSNIFKASLTTGVVDWETTLGWIENYPYSSMISLALKILLFFDPETHIQLNTYI